MSTLLLLLWPTLAVAHPGGHDAGGGGYQMQFPAPHTMVPETLPQLTAALDQQLLTVETALTGKRYADLFRGARDLKELAVALPEKSTGLSESEQATVSTASQAIESQMKVFLVAAGDGDDLAATAALAAVRAQLAVVVALQRAPTGTEDSAETATP